MCSKTDKSVVEYQNDFAYRHIASESDLHNELVKNGFEILKSKVYESGKHNHICIHAKKR